MNEFIESNYTKISGVWLTLKYNHDISDVQFSRLKTNTTS